MKIGNLNIQGIASLAPMAGITDKAFREICNIFGASYSTSEMISTKGIIYKSEKTIALMSNNKDEKPFAVQLFGNDPKDFYDAIKLISNHLPDIIDINMGCPAKKIVKENSGSALMKNPNLCGEIVKSVKEACDLPVTVKIRSGWNSINAPKVAEICAKAGADAITVHGRTKEQAYSGKNNLDVIKAVKESVNIPVIGNGDIVSWESAKYMLEYTGCDAVAIGRGAMGNPWIFSEINNQDSSKKISLEEKSRVMKLHIEKMCEYKGELVGVKEMRKHLAAYLKGFPKASEFRKDLFVAESKIELLQICENIKSISDFNMF